jgi:hypothetical protein
MKALADRPTARNVRRCARKFGKEESIQNVKLFIGTLPVILSRDCRIVWDLGWVLGAKA